RRRSGDGSYEKNIGELQPYGKGDRGMLGDAVRGRFDDNEQAGSRSRDDELAATAGKHWFDHGASGPDMGHQVDAPHRIPDFVRRLGPALVDDARVREIDVDAAEALASGGDQRLDVGLATDIAAHRKATGRIGHRSERLLVEVGEHDAGGVLGGELQRGGAPDAAGGSGNDGNLALDIHGFSFRSALSALFRLAVTVQETL